MGERFPSPNLGLSLKSRIAAYDHYDREFPSPKLGLSLKYPKRRYILARPQRFRPLIWGYL